MVDRTVISMSGTCLLGVTISSGNVAYVELCPGNLSTRLDDLRSCFTSYRFTALRLSYCHTLADSGVAYYGSAPTTSPSTLAGVVEAASAVFKPQDSTVPVTLNVPRKVLFENDYRWWRTTGSLEPYQGRIYFGSASTSVSWLTQVIYTIQFCGPTFSSSTQLLTTQTFDDEKSEGNLTTSEDPEIITHGDSQHPGPQRSARSVPRTASESPTTRGSSYERAYPPLRK